MDEVYQSLDDIDSDDSLAAEAAAMLNRRQEWLSQIDFSRCIHVTVQYNPKKTYIAQHSQVPSVLQRCRIGTRFDNLRKSMTHNNVSSSVQQSAV